MVVTHSTCITTKQLYQKNTEDGWKDTGNGITIESSFQRGDEETGVWTSKFKKSYIDSLQKGYPSGILTFVKDNKSSTSPLDPWKVLDGGNRLRTIRDYLDDKFTDENDKIFSELLPDDRANFNAILVPCQEITIEQKDPDNTIATMFIRLNTKSNPLKHGELFKAHGHRSDVIEIEIAKKIIGTSYWLSTFNEPNFTGFTFTPLTLADSTSTITIQGVDITNIRRLWCQTFSEIKESNRCDSLAMMIGYIISARTSNFTLFDKKYDNMDDKFQIYY